MRVLLLSLDTALVKQNKEGDTLKRLQEYREFCQYLGVIVPILGEKLLPKTVKRIEIIPASDANSFLSYWQIYQLAQNICQEKSVNLIVTNDAVLGAIAIWLRRSYPVKVQISIFGLEILDKYWIKEKLQNFILKWVQVWAIKRADSLRVDNTRAKKLLIKHFGIKPQKVVVIPVAPSRKSQNRFIKAKENKVFKSRLLGGNKKMVLSVGSLVKAKDFVTLIRAARLVINCLPDTVFIIAGKGSERSKLEKEIKKQRLKGNVKLIGSVSYEELPSLFASTDLFALSSTHEGFPRVLMEAALAGKPIVTTNIDGARDLIDHEESGLIVPVGNPALMADAIKDLLVNKNKRVRFGKNAKKKAKILLDSETITKQVINSWKKTVYGKN